MSSKRRVYFFRIYAKTQKLETKKAQITPRVFPCPLRTFSLQNP